jgi:DnaK suppressor protein
MQQQAMAQEQERRRRQELDQGEFGYCENCGEQIALGRLRIDPSAALCVRCAGR